jgi:hypothetical protein
MEDKAGMVCAQGWPLGLLMRRLHQQLRHFSHLRRIPLKANRNCGYS